MATLIRIPAVFAEFSSAIGACWGGVVKNLEGDYVLVRGKEGMREDPAWKYTEWNLPVDHSWPCQPNKMEGFIEKAASSLAERFASRAPQGVFIGALQPESIYFRQLASNLRGRLLQLMPASPVRDPEEQGPSADSLFCLVGKEGLFAGMASPWACNGFYPGGTKYLATKDAVSRAGAKVAGALHHLRLFDVPLPAHAHWLELGASPGGMTAELLQRGYHVTAIDRAALDPRVAKQEHLTFRQMGVGDYQPDRRFDALLCDMNGPAEESLAQMLRLSQALRKPGLIIFTLKTTGTADMLEMDRLHHGLVATARAGGLNLLSGTHLPYNRREFTLIFQRADSPA